MPISFCALLFKRNMHIFLREFWKHAFWWSLYLIKDKERKGDKTGYPEKSPDKQPKTDNKKEGRQNRVPREIPWQAA